MGIGSCLLANFSDEEGAGEGLEKATTFEQTLASCMVLRIDGEKPPATSVPNPTYKIHEKDTQYSYDMKLERR